MESVAGKAPGRQRHRLGRAAAAIAVLAAAVGSQAQVPAVDRAPIALKVYLADFEDVPRPAAYTREYFEQVFFGVGAPRLTPEGRPLAGSVREYFLDVSDGRIDITGEVADWVRIPRRITRIPHWKSGMQPFGESWPVIVAETLRANGIAGPGATQAVRFADGTMPDHLVFLNTDWAVGAVNRGWGKLEEVLTRMDLGGLWDANWAALPAPYASFSATIWREAPRSAADGTIDRVPPADELQFFPLSVMMHEMAHLLAGLPDLYVPAYAPWGVFDLMGGPAAHTHYPMGIAAFQRVRQGWMTFTDVPRTRHARLALRPLETHREALRFRQGPGQETIIIENRACLKYPRDYSQPPTDDGPRLIIHRYDPLGRNRILTGGKLEKRITSVLRRREAYGEVWGAPPFTALTAVGRPWSRNALGELWWEFREMGLHPDRSITFAAQFLPRDLVADYHQADWHDGAGAAIRPGTYGGLGGHVTLRHAATGEGGALTRVLHCQPNAGGSITGRFALPGGAPTRLYLLTACPRAGSHAPALTVAAGGSIALDNWSMPSAQGGVCVDLPADAREVSLAVAAPTGGAVNAGLHIVEGWLVDLPVTLVDLTAIPAAPRLAGVADPWSPPVLGDGFAYGPHCILVRAPAQGGEPAVMEFPLPGLPAACDLRASVGLTSDTPVGAQARIALQIVAGDDTLPCMPDLVLRMARLDWGQWPERGSNATAILELPLPEATRNTAGTRLRLVVYPAEGPPATVAVPCLRVTGR